jgi:hypothetical protein
MYAAIADPYCYPGTTVLKNRLGLRDQAKLDAFEKEVTSARADEDLPAGRLSYRHCRAIHRHLFQDVYSWAGRIGNIRIAKGGNAFCYPEHIDREIKRCSLISRSGSSCGVSALPNSPRASEAERSSATTAAIRRSRKPIPFDNMYACTTSYR